MTTIPDDGDIVRALGFVTMYSAWVEQDVDDVLKILGEDGRACLRWPVSRKLKAALKRVKRLRRVSLARLEIALEEAEILFERRNELVHGRIAVDGGRDILSSGRPDVPRRELSFEEVRDLANSFYNARDELLRVSLLAWTHDNPSTLPNSAAAAGRGLP